MENEKFSSVITITKKDLFYYLLPEYMLHYRMFMRSYMTKKGPHFMKGQRCLIELYLQFLNISKFTNGQLDYELWKANGVKQFNSYIVNL